VEVTEEALTNPNSRMAAVPPENTSIALSLLARTRTAFRQLRNSILFERKPASQLCSCKSHISSSFTLTRGTSELFPYTGNSVLDTPDFAASPRSQTSIYSRTPWSAAEAVSSANENAGHGQLVELLRAPPFSIESPTFVLFFQAQQHRRIHQHYGDS